MAEQQLSDNSTSSVFARLFNATEQQSSRQSLSLEAFSPQQPAQPRPQGVEIATMLVNDSGVNNRMTWDSRSVEARIFEQNKPSLVRIEASDAAKQSVGTGFFVTEDGLIATDLHVVREGRNGITVRTTDGRNFRATIVDADPATDLALLQVNTNGRLESFKPVTLGSSADVSQGDYTAAMGFPRSTYTPHLSVGRFDRPARLFEYDLSSNGGAAPGEDVRRVIMHNSMRVETGNSGGPKFDAYGRVIGIVGLNNVGRSSVFTLATPVEDLQRLLNRNLANRPSETIGTIANLFRSSGGLSSMGTISRDVGSLNSAFGMRVTQPTSTIDALSSMSLPGRRPN